ncbi:hypothetical protein ACIRPU_17100 [Streptomyces sp. NPDC102259]|uniref:hypothetical protein n=1 Tax=Streptomyces sp. NPDC102259 TaxID=3366148 RepID=UPI0038275A2A
MTRDNMEAQMTTPSAAWRTTVRTTTVAAFAAGIFIVGVASAHAAAAPSPAPSSDFLGSLTQQLGNILSGITSGNATKTILPTGILGG